MTSEFGITILPDLLANDLDLVIVGTAAGRASAKRRLYYAGPGNRFWPMLHEVGLTPIELRPGDPLSQLLRSGGGEADPVARAALKAARAGRAAARRRSQTSPRQILRHPRAKG